jgi:hypothetical protein
MTGFVAAQWCNRSVWLVRRSGVAQSAEQAAVNRKVESSSLSPGAKWRRVRDAGP